MKKMFVLWGALALLTAACSNEESQEVSFSPLVLTALQEGEATRTSLHTTEVHWSAGDNVAAFVGNVAHTSTATKILSAKSARFTFSDLAADAVVQYAVYPADAAAERLAGDVITVTVPTEQTAVAGSFAEGSAVAIAKGGSSTLGFKNVCGFLAFTIDADGVQSVHIYANEKMTGTADVNWNSGNPTVSVETFAYTGVKLTGPFTRGATYYAAVFPGTYTGLTLKLTHSDGYVSTYTNSNTLTISRKDNVVIASNLKLRTTPTSGTWFEKAPATIGPDVPVIIVGKVGGSYRLIANADTHTDTGDASPSAATTATVSGSTVTDVDDGFKWNLSTTDGKFTFYPAGVNTRWLNCQTTSESASQTCMAVSNYSNFNRRFFTWDAAGHLVTSDIYKNRYLSYRDGLWCGETFPASGDYPAAVFSFYVQVP